MRVSDLTGAMLDMWVGRAEGIPADQLEIRPQPMGESICVRTWKIDDIEVQKTLAYSTSWENGGPIIEHEQEDIDHGGAGGIWRAEGEWKAQLKSGGWVQNGPTLLVAAMRTFVSEKFGATLPE